MPELSARNDLDPIPPRWLLDEETADIINRRLRVAPASLIQRFFGTIPEKLQYYLEFRTAYALISLYPPSESTKLTQRLRRFGQAFPGLFNINGEPRPHDVRPTAKSQRFFMSHLIYRHQDLFLVGEGPGSILQSNCCMRLEPDSFIGVSQLAIRNSQGAQKPFKYFLYFVYIVGFGYRLKPYNFADDLDRFCVRYFGLAAESNGLKGDMRVEEAFVRAS